jgi:hypothetical protein
MYDVVVSPLGGASKVRKGWCCWEVEFVDGSCWGAGGWRLRNRPHGEECARSFGRVSIQLGRPT